MEKEYKMNKKHNNNEFILSIFILTLILFAGGIGNGLFSWSHSCSSAYLDMRKPIHYILIPHTVGYYTGRAMGYSIGKEHVTSCSTIFNQTLHGPRE